MTEINSFLADILPKARSFASQSGLNYHDCEDVLSSSTLSFWKRVTTGALDFGNNAKSYFFQQVRWKMIDKMRENASRSRHFSQIGEENDMDSLIAEQEEVSDKIEILKKAFQSIKRAKKERKDSQLERDCDIFSMTVFDGKSAEETAELVQTSKEVVYLARHRIGQKLKKILKTNGI